MGKKRLYRSETDKALCGVCGGIAEYFEVDPLIIRLLTVLFSVFFGSGVLFYIVAAIIMPTETKVKEQEMTVNVGTYHVDGVEYTNVNDEDGGPQPTSEGAKPQQGNNTGRNIGIILVVIAVLIILKEVLPIRISNTLLYAVIIAAVGIYFLVRKK